MLKKSLLTAVILGAIVAAAGAQSEETKRFQKPQPALVLETPQAECTVNATEAQDMMSDTNILEQQNSAQREQLGGTALVCGSFSNSARYRRQRHCWFTSFGYICF